MRVKIVLVLITILYLSVSQTHSESYDKISDITNMTFPQIMEKLNYPCETHYITTSDGYILTFFRMQAKNSGSIKDGLPVVYFQHGLEDTSDTICLNDEDVAPGLMIANNGYDLWLGNSRGNRYSKNHTKYSSKDKKFWEFSFQNMALYDLPVSFEYINKITNQKINYIGHSQGTIQMFIALSRQEQKIKKNLKSYIALGPVAWVGNIKSLLLRSLAHNFVFIDTLIAAGINQFLPYKDETFLSMLCTTIKQLCGLTLEFLMDMHIKYDNLNRINIFVGHFPGGTSTFNIRHWAQNICSKEFRYFDYGKLMNLYHYGSLQPPFNQIDKINVPVHLFAGQTDELADLDDVSILRQNLTSSPNVTFNEYPFGHASFLIGNDMTFMNDVFAILEDYNPKQKQIIF